jgi:hypothetical protein
VLSSTGTVELEPTKTKAIQIGRSVISFTIRQKEQPLFQPQ